MSVNAWHLPWGPRTVSHGILDLNRGCNIRCRACYNDQQRMMRPLAEIEADVAAFRARRALAYVSLVGGEVLLHEDLDAIIMRLKADGLIVQLFTNGVLLNEARMARLAATGVDIIYVHIDGGQSRPDLPSRPSPAQLHALWDEKAALIARHGVDVGLAMTAYADDEEAVSTMVDYVCASPHVNYLLVTLERDTERIAELHGDLEQGLHGKPATDNDQPRSDTLTNHAMLRRMRESHGMRPFGYLGSNRAADDPRWLSYLVATQQRGGALVQRYTPRASAFERLYCALARKLTGHYPMYQRQSTAALVLQLLFNSLMGGDAWGNLRYLAGACGGGRLAAKRLLFQCPAELGADGQLIHCLNCPDAVVKNGTLVPLCISDKVVQAASEASPTR